MTMTRGFRRPKIDLTDTQAPGLPRSIPEVIDFNAENNGDRVFCIQGTKENALREDIPITFRQLRRLVGSYSSRLQAAGLATIKSGPKPAPVALLMHSDATLLVYLFALMALGVPAVLLSARLSPLAIISLLRATSAETIIAAPQLQKIAEEALKRHGDSNGNAPAESGDDRDVAILTPVSIEKELADGDMPSDAAITTAQSFLDESDRNVLILHSSGTTGLPKPIPQSHRYLLGFCTCHIDTDAEDVEALNVSTLPLYHGFGLVAPCLALGLGKTVYLSTGSQIPTGPSTVAVIRMHNAKSLTTVPHILEEICRLPKSDGVDALLPLQFVASGGGPLKEGVGQQLADAGVKILAHFGATEIGPIAPIFVPGPEYDFRYFRVRNDYNMHVKETYKEDGRQLYELVATPFSWTKTFVLQDRLITSPTNPGHEFRAIGRMDDLIVLATGEKVAPVILETALAEHPLVKSVVAFGNDRFEVGVLVEPADASVDENTLRATLWPVVKSAGLKMDAHARVSDAKAIIFTAKGQTIPRSDKGSVLRKESYRIFSEDISRCYEVLENGSDNSASAMAIGDDDLEKRVLKLVTEQLSLTTKQHCTVDDNFFELGLDSLQAMRIRRALRTSLGSSPGLIARKDIGTDFVYKHPTAARLAEALRNDSRTIKRKASFDESMLKDLVKRYAVQETIADQVIILTGSTGSLGCHVLAHLISRSTVVEVICLLRPSASDPYGRQLASLKEKGIALDASQQRKITALATDTAEPSLGLSAVAYTAVMERATHVLHAAWPMDFQRGLESFTAQFKTLQNLLRLSLDTSARNRSAKPRIVFVSSIAVVGHYMQARGTRFVPEAPLSSTTATNAFGYGRAKLVCEHIMEDAAQRFSDSISCSVVRVGQLSGSEQSGYWNPKEHFPTLVRMSHNVGKLPELKGTLSWIPVDSAATVLSDVLSNPKSNFMLHLENPMRQPCREVIESIAEALSISSTNIVPFDEWLSATADHSKRHEGAEDRSDMLFDFFKNEFEHMSGGSVVLETSNTRAVSPTLRAMNTVDYGTTQKYVAWWKASGSLQLDG